MHVRLIQAEPEPIEIDLFKTAVLVVDMQNAFVRRGGYFDQIGYDISGTENIIKPCIEITSLSREKRIKIIYLQMEFDPNLFNIGELTSPGRLKSRGLTLIRQRPDLKEKLHIPGAWGTYIIEELEPQKGDVIIKKQKHDAFIGTNLDIILRTSDIRYVVFIGTATNICVESTLRHAFSLEYFPIIVSDAVSQMGPGLTQEATLYNVRSTFGWVTTSEKFLSAIRGILNS